MTNYVAVSGTNHAYRVYLRNGAEQELTERLMAFSQGKKLVFLSDQQTHRIHGARIVASLTQRGVAVVEVIVEGGERAKSLSQLESIYSQLLRSGVNRSDRLICFGGGRRRFGRLYCSDIHAWDLIRAGSNDVLAQ